MAQLRLSRVISELLVAGGALHFDFYVATGWNASQSVVSDA